jgi:hypothetical protein
MLKVVVFFVPKVGIREWMLIGSLIFMQMHTLTLSHRHAELVSASVAVVSQHLRDVTK